MLDDYLAHHPISSFFLSPEIKVDKASVLDEVIEYLKTLQGQLQVKRNSSDPAC